tara:strand:+ start:30 stop:1169 length:1140 start_codon:yes stop_codon:yes gene_type:complete
MALNIERILYFFMGFICFSLSFTSLREMGLGRSFEILFFCIILTLLAFTIHFQRFRYNLSFIPLLYIVFVMGPLTLLNYSQDFPGTSIETLLALILSSVTGLATAQAQSKYMKDSALGIGAASFLILFTLFSSGLSLDGIVRFSALSDNPNQLALYALVGMVIITLYIENIPLKTLFILVLVFSGSLALSDAYFLAIAAGIFAYIFAKSIFSLSFLIFGLPFLLISSILLLLWAELFFSFDVIELVLELWRQADQGGTRSSLYINGILAFIYSPLVGHGGGAFAGIHIPFETFEAHNTVIDFATMGGIIMPIIFYSPFIAGLFLSLKKNPLVSASISAFLVFSLFHFIGRHPIVWVAWGACFGIFLIDHLKDKITLINN